MCNLDFIFDISVVKNEETVETCNFDKIKKSEKKKDFWSDSDFNWNNELLKLCCNFIFNFDSIDSKNLLMIQIENFSVNHSRYTVNAVKLINISSVVTE